MRQKQKFVKPAIRQEFSLLPGTPILSGSIVEQTTITSTGQEVQEYNGGDPTFNHNWE